MSAHIRRLVDSALTRIETALGLGWPLYFLAMARASRRKRKA